MGSVPGEVYLVTGSMQICNHGCKILLDEVWEHKKIVKARSPSRRRFRIRGAPEPSHQRTYEQLLGKTHPRVRRHLERAKLQETQPAGCRVGRIQLVDRELRPMRVAGQVGEQMAQQPVGQPRR